MEYIEREAAIKVLRGKEVKYELDMISDEAIREWMNAEMRRLGEWFDDFEISWFRNERKYLLEIWSNAKYDYGHPNHPHGKGFTVAEIYHMDGETLPIIQSEGRKLYHRLKKDYIIHRDLGKARCRV